MKTKDFYKNHYRQYVFNAILKSLLTASLFGFAGMFVTAFVTWCLGKNGIIWCVIVPVGIIAVLAPIFYFVKYKPTNESVARAVDGLGMEERFITMEEYKNVDTEIARLQRYDACEKLGTVKNKRLKFYYPKKGIIACSVTAGVALLMTLAMILGYLGIIWNGGVIIDNITGKDKVKFHEVIYVVEGGGLIEGRDEQNVADGEDATAVMAVADEDWGFYSWSDGLRTPTRTDYNVVQDLKITAIFKEVQASGGGQPMPGEGGQPGPDGVPGDNDGDNKGNNPTGSRKEYITNDYIIDGETNYLDWYDYYRDLALTMIASGEEIPEDLKAIIDTYFKSIE